MSTPKEAEPKKEQKEVEPKKEELTEEQLAAIAGGGFGAATPTPEPYKPLGNTSNPFGPLT